MEYKLIRSERKTVEISINDELEIIVRAPNNMSQNKIEEFIAKSKKWIEKHIESKQKSLGNRNFSKTDEEAARNNALQYLTERTKYFSKITGLEPPGAWYFNTSPHFLQ